MRPTEGAGAAGGLRLFHKLLLVSLAVGLFPLLGLALALFDANAAALRYSTRQLHLAIASDARRAVRAQLSTTRAELLGIGHLLLAPGPGSDDERIKLAGSKVTASETLGAVAIYDPAGRLVVGLRARESAGALPVQQLDPLLLQRLVPGELVPGEVVAGPLGPLLPVHLAVDLEGKRRAVLATTVDLLPLCRTVGELGERRLAGSDGVLLVDSRRQVVVAADPARALAHEALGSQGIFSAFSGDLSFRRELGASPEFLLGGREMLGALEAMPELEWAVIVQEPRAVAYHSLAVMRRQVAVAVLLAALLAAGAGLLLSRRLSRPIAQLAAEARKIGGRSFGTVPAALTERGDEIGALGRDFDRMARDLAASEEKLVEETRARSTLSRYLSADVVEAILKDPAKLRLGGERREVTVLFADVVSFTRLSEQQAPEVIVTLLNELFTFATEIIHRRGGITDKFIGDCVMGVFGTPEQHPDDALRAVLAAEDLRRWLDTANRKWRRQFGLELRLSMGINTGPAVAGNIGSERRMEYTVIGDAVNVAARLESMAAPGQILLTEATRARLPQGFPLQGVGEATVRGRAGATQLYEVMG